MTQVARSLLLVLLLVSSATFSIVTGFIMPSVNTAGGDLAAAATKKSSLYSSSDEAVCASPAAVREATYGGANNMAKYLVDLHDNKATFDFCGGMLFQLVLTDKLRNHLLLAAQVVASSESLPLQQQQPVVVFDASQPRMHQIPNYETSSMADNVRIFHGREIRQVKDAAGGMGMVLQLSLANNNDNDASDNNNIIDPDGWTRAEIQGYDGWRHDVGRVWRNGNRLQDEGFVNFQEKFGTTAYTLNHRFYWHLDRSGALWLAAEDGCEGTPASSSLRSMFAPIAKLFGF